MTYDMRTGRKHPSTPRAAQASLQLSKRETRETRADMRAAVERDRMSGRMTGRAFRVELRAFGWRLVQTERRDSRAFRVVRAQLQGR